MTYVPTTNEMETIRTWVGDTFLEDEIGDIFDRLEGNMDKTIIEVLRRMKIEAAENPSQITLPSGLNVGFTHTVQAIERTLQEFLRTGGTDAQPDVSTLGVFQLHRPDLR